MRMSMTTKFQGLKTRLAKTKVAQLLAKLPMKTGPTSLLTFHKWAEISFPNKLNLFQYDFETLL
jgi:hypothetical protein